MLLRSTADDFVFLVAARNCNCNDCGVLVYSFRTQTDTEDIRHLTPIHPSLSPSLRTRQIPNPNPNP